MLGARARRTQARFGKSYMARCAMLRAFTSGRSMAIDVFDDHESLENGLCLAQQLRRSLQHPNRGMEEGYGDKGIQGIEEKQPLWEEGRRESRTRNARDETG